MAGLTPKDYRTLARYLASIYGKRGFRPLTMEAVRSLGRDLMRYELELPGGQTLLLTDHGRDALNGLTRLIGAAQLVPLTEADDSARAVHAVINRLLSARQMPDGATELVALVTKELEAIVQTYWFVVPLYGIELKDVEIVQLGGLQLFRPTQERLAALGATFGPESNVEQSIGNWPCLVGQVRGSKAYAETEFRYMADVAIGVIAVVAAAHMDSGVTPFRLTLGMTTSGTRGVARHAFWNADSPSITWVRGWMEHVPLSINAMLADTLEGAHYIRHGFQLAGRTDLSPLEQALVRAFFWFADAQRDHLPVMQLVKFWSCAESIFTPSNGKEITKSISEGVAGILIDVRQKQPEEYRLVVKELVALYDQRSTAVHSAWHNHVTQQDIAKLSRWTAWMLLGIAGLITECGFKDVEQVRERSQFLASRFKPA